MRLFIILIFINININISFSEEGLVCKDISKKTANNGFFYLSVQKGKSGDGCSSRYVADMYYYGVGTDKNYKAAAKWYEFSANQGVVNAKYDLALMYLDGVGVKKNLKKAFLWFEDAAKFNHPSALYNLGVFYEQGLHVKENMRLSLIYYDKAADLGFVNAMVAAANIYIDDKLIPYHENTRPFVLLKNASNKGSHEAMYYLAYCYFKGIGVDKNKGKGIEYMVMAKELGNTKAKKFLSLLNDHKKELL